jgi:hypothetical protein
MIKIPTDYKTFPLNQWVYIKIEGTGINKGKRFDILLKACSNNYETSINDKKQYFSLSILNYYPKSNKWIDKWANKQFWTFNKKEQYDNEEFYLIESEEELNELIIQLEI